MNDSDDRLEKVTRMTPSTSSLFTEAWDLSDVVFSVERSFIYANKTVLSMWSPVMKAMFSDDFVERHARVIELPAKRFDDFLELVRILHPPNKEIDDGNVGQLLPLAREYQIDELTRRCEQFLLNQQLSVLSLVYAEEYTLRRLERQCLAHVNSCALKVLIQESHFQDLSDKLRIKILQDKAERYEQILDDIKRTIEGDRPEQIRFRAEGTLCTFICPYKKKSWTEGPHNAGTELKCRSCAVYMTKMIADRLAESRI